MEMAKVFNPSDFLQSDEFASTYEAEQEARREMEAEEIEDSELALERKSRTL